MADFSDVLIVIPCLNEEANLARLLAQFRREAPGALIVVADGGSTDTSRAIAGKAANEAQDITTLENPQRIQAAGINLAVARYAGERDWLVRVDAHCVYPAHFIRILIEAAISHEADSVVVPMITKGKSWFQRAAAAAQNSLLGNGGAVHRNASEGLFVDHGHHALFRLSSFRKIGGYDDNFSHNEDAELDVRLGAAGGRIWLEGQAAVIYFPRSGPGALFRQYFRYGMGRARTGAKHNQTLKLRQALPLGVMPAGLLALIALLSLPFAPYGVFLALPLVTWAASALFVGVGLAVCARDVCVLGAGFAAMLMHMGWSCGYWRETFRRLPPRQESQTPRF